MRTSLSFKFFPGAVYLVLTGSGLMLAAGPMRAADALEQLLREESQPVLRKSRPETVVIWTNLLTVADGSETNRIRELAEQFGSVNDVTEPYQKDFAASVLQVLDLFQGQWVPPGTDKMEEQLKTLQGQETSLRQSITNAIAVKDKAEKDLNDKKSKHHTASKFVSIFRHIPLPGVPHVPDAGGAADATKDFTEEDVRYAQEKFEAAEKKLNELNEQLDGVLKAMPNVEEFVGNGRAKHAREVRDGLLTRITQLNRDRNAQAAMALANLWLRFIDNDEAVIHVANQAMVLHKKQERAAEIADEVGKQANEFLERARPWSAKKEIEEAGNRIRELVHDDQELAFMVARDLGAVRRQAEARIDDAMKLRDGIFARSKTDDKVLERFEEFARDHPDYPNIEADRSALVVYEYQAEIDAIRTILASKPRQAYERLQKMGPKLTERHADILKAQIMEMTDQILDTTVASLTKRLDGALDILQKADNASDRVIRQRLKDRAKREEAAVYAEARAWTNQPMNEVTKAKFVAILDQEQPTTVVKVDWINSLPMSGPTFMGFLAVLLVGWFVSGRRRSPPQ